MTKTRTKSKSTPPTEFAGLLDAPTSAASGKINLNGNGHAQTPAPTAQPVAFDPDEIQRVSPKAIVANPNNPRKHFDEAKLIELATSIRTKGVLQPILLRPHPDRGARVSYQLVAGERRWRASHLAGCSAIPAIIRNFSDQDVREIQVIENEQREDVSPLEKASGYQALIDEDKYTVEKIAEKVGKSISTIRSILKLRLLPDKAREALESGDIEPSVAGLIARVPGEKARAEVAKFAMTGDRWDHELPSYRQVKHVIQQTYMVELKAAPFDRKSLEVVPAAGSCDACPKRTGNDRDSFPEARADVCTDVACYHAKTKAWQNQQTVKAKAVGQTVLSEKAAAEVFSHYNDGLQHNAPYVDLAERCYDVSAKGGSRTWGKLLEDHVDEKEIVLGFDRNGNLHRLVDKAKAAAIAKKEHGIGSRQASTSAADAQARAEQQKLNREREMKKEANRRVAGKVADYAQLLANGLGLNCSTPRVPMPEQLMLRWIAHGLIDAVWDDASREVVKRRGLEKLKGEGNRERLHRLVTGGKGVDSEPGLNGDAVIVLMAEIVAIKRLEFPDAAYSKLITDLFRVDRKEVEEEVRAEAAAKAKGKKKPATDDAEDGD